MKRFLLAWASAALLIAACGDSGSSSTDTTGGDTSTGTDTIADTTTTPGTSAITGVSTDGVSCTEPTFAQGCTGAGPNAATSGFSYPWCGLDTGVDDYTCQGCPNGIINFQGTYRAIKDGTASPPELDFEDYKETVAIDGNTFALKILDDNGDLSEAKGWILCTETPENNAREIFWVQVDGHSPSGSWKAGAIERTANVIVTGTDAAVIYWYDDLTGEANVSQEYCRIGGTIGGVDCTDPFAN